MVFTQSGRSGLALLLAATTSGESTFPEWVEVGTGSAAVLVTDRALVTPSGNRIRFTSRDSSIEREVTWTFDYSSVAISGTTNITEFGLFPSGPTATGSLWVREGFNGINFDGTAELQIQITAQIF
jgi:hypothetical protein